MQKDSYAPSKTQLTVIQHGFISFTLPRGGVSKRCESEEDDDANSIIAQIVAAIVPQAAVLCSWGKDAARSRRVCCKSATSLPQVNAKPNTPAKQAHNNTETATQQLQSSQGCGLRTSGRRAIRSHPRCNVVGELSLGASLVPRSACPCGRGKVAARSAILRHFFGLFFWGSFLARKRFFLGSVARPKFRYGAFLTFSRFRWRKLPNFTKKCRKS